MNYFQELINLTSYFFQRPDIKIEVKENEVVGLEKLKKAKELLANLKDWKEENIRHTLCDKKLFPLIRKKLTGLKSGPELPKIIYLLGKEEVLKRIS